MGMFANERIETPDLKTDERIALRRESEASSFSAPSFVIREIKLVRAGRGEKPLKKRSIVSKIDVLKRNARVCGERMDGLGDIGEKECQKLTFTKSGK